MSTSASGTQNQKRSVSYDGQDFETIREGLAEILVPHTAPDSGPETVPKAQPEKKDGTKQSVFYNPIQQFNRDLSVLTLRIFAEDLANVLDQKAAQERTDSKSKKQKKRRRTETATEDGERPTKAPKFDEQLDNEDTAVGGPVQDPQPADCAAGTRDTAAPVATDEEHSHPESMHKAWEKNGDQAEQPPPAAGTPTVPKPKAPRPDPPRRPFRVLDALSATGLRALRYAKEVPQVTCVTANDLDPAAAAAIRRNVAHNDVGSRVQPTTGNAAAHMYAVGSGPRAVLPDGGKGKYQVIDLDPYGTAAPFLDAAVQALADGGLLGVTCTDAGVFASPAYAEKTFSLYGGLPLKGPHAHECGVRLILHAIATSAARYGIAVEPLLSLSIDFYVRVFVRLRRAPHEVKHLAAKTVLVYSCGSGCGAWKLQYLGQQQEKRSRNGEPWWKFSLPQAPTTGPFCEHCGFKAHLGGPMWGGPLHNPYFVQRMLDVLPTLSKETYGTTQRLEGMLNMARDETLLPLDLEPIHSGPKQAATASEVPTNGAQQPASADKTATHEDTPNPHPVDTLPPIPRLPPNLRDPAPFFLYPSILARALATTAPSNDALRGALRRLGYRATRSHTKPGSLRTDAPWPVVWEIMRRWARDQHKAGWAPAKNTVGAGIWRRGTQGSGGVELARWRAEVGEVGQRAEDVEGLKRELQALLWRMEKGDDGENGVAGKEAVEKALANGNAGEPCGDAPSPRSDGKEPGERPEDASEKKTAAAQRDEKLGAVRLAKLDIVFDEALGREEPRKGLVRYQVNPAPYWGPMSKAR